MLLHGFLLSAALAVVPPLPCRGVTSKPFHGVKVNGGTVTYVESGGKRTLTLSSDFLVPDSPAPHWQVVDSCGGVHLLQRLVIKGGVFHRSIELPDHVPDVARVQIWCAWAEVVLGETSFDRTLAPRAVITHESGTFAGKKANKGRVLHVRRGASSTLTLSKDFVVPNAPAPHWQVVDSCGRTYLLQRLVIKGGKLNRTITVPAYIKDVAKVQIWCAFAETLLGEATFASPVM